MHTMLRVKDLDESIRFYTEQLGMHVLRRMSDGDGKSIAFIGYGSEDENAVLELQHSASKIEFVRGEFFGHLAIGVPDAHKTFAALCQSGAKSLREPRLKDDEVIASIEDPNGYKIELIEVRA